MKSFEEQSSVEGGSGIELQSAIREIATECVEGLSEEERGELTIIASQERDWFGNDENTGLAERWLNAAGDEGVDAAGKLKANAGVYVALPLGVLIGGFCGFLGDVMDGGANFHTGKGMLIGAGIGTGIAFTLHQLKFAAGEIVRAVHSRRQSSVSRLARAS